MTRPGRVSVVVVSHARPGWLVRCVDSLRWQDHPAVEVIVVADSAGLAALTAAGLDGRVKTVAFPGANIAAARNAGIAAAAGDAVAFIDDDAVAEPTWVSHLAAPLLAGDAAAAGGTVRGPDGISLDSRPCWADRAGAHHALAADGPAVRLHPGHPGRAIRTEGTNMAFRRDVLTRMGGFDPVYRYYLDDTDLNMRLAAAGMTTAIVPLAEVHHALAPGPVRRPDRAPRELTAIGASMAAFLARHAPAGQHAAAKAAFRERQRRRLLRHLQRGTLEPRDLPRLTAGLEAGLASGAGRTAPWQPAAQAPPPFLPLTGTATAPGAALAGWRWQGARLRRRAALHLARGVPVTLFLFTPGWRRHRTHYETGGLRVQTGGLRGRSSDAGPATPARTVGERRDREIARLSGIRPLAPSSPSPGSVRENAGSGREDTGSVHPVARRCP